MQAIFDGGRLTSQRDETKEREAEPISGYRRTILNALVDIESAPEAFRISELQYREGAADLLTVLQAQ
jgi:outer membrane protein TolC